MSSSERRQGSDRRRVPRGGRRSYDQPGRHPKLLIADSYDGARIPCVRYLDHFGFHVEQAVDGDQVLAALSTTKPDVILMERGLPLLSARTLGDRLEEHDDTRTIPIIVMTSEFDVDGTHVEAASGILVKPFPLSSMIEEVRRALRACPPRTGVAPPSQPL